MNKNAKTSGSQSPVVLNFEPRYPAHPMKVVRDKYGRLWLCGAGVDEDGDIEAQGGWRCEDLTFTCIG